MNVASWPPDQYRGLDVGPAAAFYGDGAASYGDAVLVALPETDLSMPFNVATLQSTLGLTVRDETYGLSAGCTRGHELIVDVVRALPREKLSAISIRRPTLADAFVRLGRGMLTTGENEEPASLERSTAVRILRNEAVVLGALRKPGGSTLLVAGQTRPQRVPVAPPKYDDDNNLSHDAAGWLSVRRGGGSFEVGLARRSGLVRLGVEALLAQARLQIEGARPQLTAPRPVDGARGVGRAAARAAAPPPAAAATRRAAAAA